MSERKVLNKYYPPDFDPSKIPRLRLPKDRQYTVRLMAPCNMRCTTCGEYIYKGKKFNARKETVTNEEYLGIKIYRFYIKCPRCLAEITFKTDPENADYIVEHGASRNFQALKLAEAAAEREAREKEEDEKNNPMKLLENRTKQSKNEMESLEALEEIKDLNQRHAKVDFEMLLKQNHKILLEEQQKQEDEDEAFINSVFLTADGEKIKRLRNTEPAEREITFVGPNSGKVAPTDILCKEPDSTMHVSKKAKLDDFVPKSSRQSSLDMLKKAVKLKKNTVENGAANTASSKSNNNVSAVSSSLQQNISTVSNSSQAKTMGLSLLSTYSDSSSDSS